MPLPRPSTGLLAPHGAGAACTGGARTGPPCCGPVANWRIWRSASGSGSSRGAVKAVTAWRPHQMVQPGRETPELPAGRLFSDIEIPVPNDFARVRGEPLPPDPGRAALPATVTGGYLKNRRKPYVVPGVENLRKGSMRLLPIAQAVERVPVRTHRAMWANYCANDREIGQWQPAHSSGPRNFNSTRQQPRTTIGPRSASRSSNRPLDSSVRFAPEECRSAACRHDFNNTL